MTFERIITPRNRHGIRILIPVRRTAPRFEQQPQGVAGFTNLANQRARSANKARRV